MANMIARLGVVLGLDSAEFVRGIEQAGKKLGDFVDQAQAKAKIGAVALGAMVTEAMRFADEMSDMAKANDVTIDSILKLSNALATSGGHANDAGKLFASFTKFVDKAAEGSYEAQQVFKKTGVTLKDLAGADTQQLFEKTLKGIASIEDPITRNAKAMEVFGKAAKGVDFPGVVQDLNRMKDITDQQSEGIQAMGDAFDKLAESARKFKVQLSSELGPAVVELVDYFVKSKENSNTFVTVIKTAFEALAVFAVNTIYVFKQVGLEVQTIFLQIGALIKGNFDQFAQLRQEAIERAKKDREEIDALSKRILGVQEPASFRASQNYGPGMSPAIKRQIIPGEDTKELARLKHIQDLINRGQEEFFKDYGDFLRQQNDVIKGIDNEQEARKRAYETEQKYIDLMKLERSLTVEEMAFRKELIQLDYQHAETVRKIEESMYMDAEEKERRLQKENELYAKSLDLARQRLSVEKARRDGGFMEGAQQGFVEWTRKLPTEFERGQQAFSTMMDTMDAALERFVRTGKLSFRDLIRDMIQNLLLLQMKAQMNSIFGSFLGKLFGTGNVYGPGDYNQGMPGFGGAYADGGSIPANKVSLVGERGPELFVPRSAGTIVPNNQLSGVGGTTNVTNNYINAIDTKSFEERLMGSSRAIWAANTYAQKSLAVGTGRM